MREFDSYTVRDSGLLIMQAGDANNRDCFVPRSRADQVYDSGQKEKNLMERLDKQCLQFDKYDKRSHNRSIYNINNSVDIDPLYNTEKLKHGIKKTTKGTGKSVVVNLDKQEKRNFKKM